MKPIKQNDLIEVVRASHDIGEVVGRHLELNSRNQSKCPFHQDDTPSFSVNSDGQYFHCFGCGVGGDVFRFLELIENKPFKQVLHELAAEAGIDLTSVAPSACELRNTEQQVRRILTLTANYYHSKLSAEARSYLADRGFSEDTISRFQIGYASGGLRQRLLDEERIPNDLAIRAGVLIESDGKVRDYFYKRIIFPNSVRGQVVHLTGRSLDDQQAKYLHLSGKVVHLFNEADAGASDVILCEGVPDCLSATQAGYRAVGVYGTLQFKEEHVDLFSRAQTVYVCMDGDEAGRKATERIGTLLADKAVIVTLPDGQDVNSFLASRGPEEFRRILDSGLPYLDLEYSRLMLEPESKKTASLERFLPKLANLSDFQRNRYIDMVKRDFKMSKATIDKGIRAADRVASSATQIPANIIDNTPSESELVAAMDLLRDPDLLGRLNEDLEAARCVGEINNKIMIYLTITSRLLEKPINLIVKGDSSGGKSHLVEKVSQLFPQEQLLKFTALTPMALYHLPDKIAHKAMIVCERPGAEASDYPIRALQSEGNLVLSIPIKDPETNQINTQEKKVEGPIAFIETTTKTHLHDENETRCFEIFIDDSIEQTRKIHEVQRFKYKGSGQSTSIDLQLWRTAQSQLKSHAVIIPFVDFIKFPDQPLRVRRDFERFLTLISVSAILHQFQREKIPYGDGETVVATIADYTVAYELASVVLESSLRQLTKKGEQLIQQIQEMTERNGKEFNLQELTTHVGWNRKTVMKYLRELAQLGYVDIPDFRRGAAAQCKFVRLPDKYDNQLVSPSDLSRLFEADKHSDRSMLRKSPFGQVKSLANSALPLAVQFDIEETGNNCENR